MSDEFSKGLRYFFRSLYFENVEIVVFPVILILAFFIVTLFLKFIAEKL